MSTRARDIFSAFVRFAHRGRAEQTPQPSGGDATGSHGMTFHAQIDGDAHADHWESTPTRRRTGRASRPRETAV